MNFGLPTSALGSGLSIARVLGSVSRTLGVLRQFAPLYRDIKPILKKAPVVLERINNFRMASRNINNGISNTVTSNAIEESPKLKHSGPVFFQ